MDQIFRFRDNYNFVPIAVDKSKRSLFETKDADSPTGYSLAVISAVSHSGILTANNAFYLPSEMKKALSTWVEPFKKPVGVHHDDYRDPIGRVQFAEYTDTSDFLKRSHSFVDKLNNISVDIDEARKIANYIVKNIWDSQSNYRGLGYIKVGSTINDPEAIEKILDGRYLTVSIHKYAREVVCSQCGQHWRRDGLCEHTPGMVDEESGDFVFKIPLDERYAGYDYVNNPANPFGMDIAVGEDFNSLENLDSNQLDSLQVVDTLKWKSSSLNKQLEVIPDFYALSVSDKTIVDVVTDNFSNICDSAVSTMNNLEALMEDSMPLDKKDKKKDQEEDLKDSQEEEQAEEATSEEEETKDENLEDQGDESGQEEQEEEREEEAGDQEETKDSEESEDESEESEESEEETKDEDERPDFGELIDFMTERSEEEFYNTYMVPELEALDFADKKLSAAERKQAQKEGKTCGPDGAFPAPDCAHVRAGFRLLNKYKGPGSKEKIRDCLERFNKKMSCGVNKDQEEAKDNEQPDEVTTCVDNLKSAVTALSDLELTDDKTTEIVNIMWTLVDKYETFTPIKALKRELKVTEGICQSSLNESDALVNRIDELKDEVRVLKKFQGVEEESEEEISDSDDEEKLPGKLDNITDSSEEDSEEDKQATIAKRLTEIEDNYNDLLINKSRSIAEAYRRTQMRKLSNDGLV